MSLVYLFTILLVTMMLCACTTEEKPKSEEEAFKEYVALIGLSAPMLVEVNEHIDKGREAVLKGNYDEAIEELKKAIETCYQIKENYKRAGEIINDPELKLYAEYNYKVVEYQISGLNALIKAIEYLKKGDIKKSREYQEKSSEYFKLRSEYAKKSHELYLKLTREGKL